jgi:hypothetical protein
MFMAVILSLLVISAAMSLANANDYKHVKYPKDKLNVHLFAHTHDDPGWLKTVDQYFYGRYSNH